MTVNLAGAFEPNLSSEFLQAPAWGRPAGLARVQDSSLQAGDASARVSCVQLPACNTLLMTSEGFCLRRCRCTAAEACREWAAALRPRTLRFDVAADGGPDQARALNSRGIERSQDSRLALGVTGNMTVLDPHVCRPPPPPPPPPTFICARIALRVVGACVRVRAFD